MITLDTSDRHPDKLTRIYTRSGAAWSSSGPREALIALTDTLIVRDHVAGFIFLNTIGTTILQCSSESFLSMNYLS